MRFDTMSVIRSVAVAAVLLASASATTAVAGSGNKQYNRGCADAKAGSYDRANHNANYEKGWQACKKQSAAAAGGGDEYDRGCADAKAGSYDRANHNADYESGWQHCKSGATAAGGADEYDRGCADAKVGSYDRANHNADYESGWQHCKSGAAAAGGGAVRQAPSKFEQACLAAVSNKANNREVTVLDSVTSQANNVVTIGVGAQRAPWRCLVSSTGVVEDVMYDGKD